LQDDLLDRGGPAVSVNSNNAADQPYPFLSEIAEIRRRARRHIEDVGSLGEAAPVQVLRLLNEVLATELVCVSRYQNHLALQGEALAESVRGELQRYAREEQGHADRLAERIVELGGQPVSRQSPAIALPASNPVEELDAEAIVDLLEEDLIAERIAIDSYREIVRFVGERDPRTRELLEAILAVEVAHAHELSCIRSEMLRQDRLIGSSTSLPRLDAQCA
jgi:bacterioferritin